MKSNLFFSTILCVLFNYSCSSQSYISELNNLEGIWKVENKDTYETWKKDSKTSFSGSSYKLVNNEKKVTETLALNENDGKVVYQATVLNQNQGSTILFTLNTENKELFSFENLAHDFPKKIQYKVITKDKLLVNVFGDNDEGFSYYLIRQ